MFYLANDGRTDLATRRCWTCHREDNPRTATVCAHCGAPLRDRRFLVTARWAAQRYDAYVRFARKRLDHPGVAAPIDVFLEDGVLFSVVPYNGEGLMLDEAAPLANHRLLDLGQRILGAIAYLHRHGVRLAGLNRANLLVDASSSVRLFDLEIESATENGATLPPEEEPQILGSVGELLRRYCDVEAGSLVQVMELAERGEMNGVVEFGRAIERSYEEHAGMSFPPLIGGMSDVGRTRQLNEDNWGWMRLSERARLYVVADGMGGHDGGEVASALAVRTLCETARARETAAPDGEQAIENLLDESFQVANNTIKDTAEARGTDMGTTLVCMLVLHDKVGFVANVGDSRCYVLHEGALTQVTKDHSLVQKLVERGRIAPEEARNHPQNHILLRTVGTERDIEIDLFRVDLTSGDRVLLCSDGLWGEVDDREIESILTTYADPRIAARELVRAAHQGGGKDNVTLMVVTIP
jgi:protein phosphatase